MLAMHANKTVSRDELVDGVWGDDPPATAVNSLHIYVAGLRRALEPGRARRAPATILPSSGAGYQLWVEPGQPDAVAFGQWLAKACALRAAGDLASAGRSLEAACALWQKAPLSGVPGSWAQTQRVRLSEMWLTLIEERTEIMLARGAHTQAAAELAGLVREHPLRERFRGQLMLTLYRCGRQAEALAVFADTRRLLIDELGIEPGPELRRLHEQILAADETLRLPHGRRAPHAHRRASRR
jgi:DNA-binding SARP family transcriptional activator